ncbi:MAG: hypothetical protein JO167_00335 [Alphaproteobacteria bacterium]|nr:hypothetical protein [Alphaproteobacteria bacterium]
MGVSRVMPYFNGFAIGVFAAAALTVLSGSVMTRANASEASKPAAAEAHNNTVADLRYARAVSWISTSHLSR